MVCLEDHRLAQVGQRSPMFYGWVIVLASALGMGLSNAVLPTAAGGPLPLELALDYRGGYAPGLVIFGALMAVSAVLGFGCRPPPADPRDDAPP